MGPSRLLDARRWLWHGAVAVLALVALALPATAAAGAEQIVITLVDEPVPWEFDDPCTGEAVHGLATESGVIRITELGDRGHHDRVNVEGSVVLYDADENVVGTWTYQLVFTDQFPPDGQGAVHFSASGPLAYVDGHTAIVHVFHHHVFGKGDVEKRLRDTAVCGGRK